MRTNSRYSSSSSSRSLARAVRHSGLAFRMGSRQYRFRPGDVLLSHRTIRRIARARRSRPAKTRARAGVDKLPPRAHLPRRRLLLAQTPKFHRYAIGCRKLPPLRDLQGAAFAGRALHTNLEAWSAEAQKLHKPQIPPHKTQAAVYTDSVHPPRAIGGAGALARAELPGSTIGACVEVAQAYWGAI